MQRLRKIWCAILLLAVLFTSSAMAELTNKDLQLGGGFAAINSTDTFFFAPVDVDESKWGLYSLNTLSNEKPIVTIGDVKPARLVYADEKKVYFLAFKNADTYLLASCQISNGELKKEIEGVLAAFVEGGDTMLYVPEGDPYTISRFSFKDGSDKKLKTMTSKTIYDACESDDTIYFLGTDKSKKLYGYEINKKSGKAVNTSNPSPAMGDGMMYGDYLVYSQNGDTTKIYALPLGKSKSVRLGERIGGMSLTNPRFGAAIYPYDKTNNAIVRVPLDGSEQSQLKMEWETVPEYIMGGYKDKILYMDNDKVYSVNEMLAGKTELFDFPYATDGMKWAYLTPTNQNYVIVMGYMPITYTELGVGAPTAVHVVNLDTKETVFQYPVLDLEAMAEAAAVAEEAGDTQTPQAIILVEDVDDDEDVSFAELMGGKK